MAAEKAESAVRHAHLAGCRRDAQIVVSRAGVTGKVIWAASQKERQGTARPHHDSISRPAGTARRDLARGIDNPILSVSFPPRRRGLRVTALRTIGSDSATTLKSRRDMGDFLLRSDATTDPQ